jgi:hypothetical protein
LKPDLPRSATSRHRGSAPEQVLQMPSREGSHLTRSQAFDRDPLAGLGQRTPAVA